MIKRTLYFGNPSYLHMRNDQLLVRLPEVEKNEDVPERFKKDAVASIPIEDIGVLVLDHKQITISHALLSALLDNNCAVISCDGSHHPSGLMMPLCGNKLQQERFRAQIEASIPLKKQLWQQTIASKIRNQAGVLEKQGAEVKNMLYWADSVKSGDSENHEARAAAYYWKTIFPEEPGFLRDRFGLPPNNLLNYGYAVLRAIVARALVASGLLPTLGLHHHNKYNAYCLADDIMEPYRPFVDQIVREIIRDGQDVSELSPSLKKELLGIAAVDIVIDKERSPLMVGLQRTTASLVKCFEGSSRKLLYPELC
jgi:CRISP-associated protein Cas1